MSTTDRIAVWCVALFLVHAQAGTQPLFRHPQPGDIYREYSRTINGYSQWRVTDPNTQRPAAMANLPNATLSIDISDLQGAVRAEAVIDLWQGHAGTTGKAISFNGNGWISVPDLSTPPTSGECYLAQYNVVVDVPLSHLATGTNYFQGTNAGQTCYSFDWGQHGMNGIVIRIYYGSSKPHPTGSITGAGAGQTISENPTFTANASGPAAIKQVDYIAYYDGLDEDGDGVYRDWHYYYHRTIDETSMPIKGHVGSATSAPYAVTWNTSLVPDQSAGSIRLLARIQDVNGMWYVTDEVTGLSLQRSGTSVRLYKATDVPERMGVRLTREQASCSIPIPSTDTLSKATSATMLISSWNGNDGNASPGSTFYTRLNSWTTPVYGENHFYALDYIAVPLSQLRTGTNSFTIFCDDSSTGTQIHWPGPQLVVTFSGGTTPPAPGAPELVSPADNVSNVSTSPTLRWRVVTGALTYRVQVALDAGFTSVVVDDSTVTDTTETLSGLSLQSLYYWRVRAKNMGGSGDFSPTWSFTTDAGAPALLAPADGQSNQVVPAMLQWRAQRGALAYWLQVSPDTLFGGALTVNDSTVLDTFKLVGNLEGGRTYSWRVRTRTISGPGAFSPAWSFTTQLALPSAVNLASPSDQEVIAADSVIFSWNPAEPSVSRYWLEIGADPTFVFKTIDSMLTDTSKVVRGLISNITYFWRMRAYNTAGWGPFGAARQFKLVYTGVDPDQSVPAEYSLLQNYPNPFNPSTQITFGIPRESRVRLEVFNLLGERIMTAVDGMRAAGYHRVALDGASLPAGMYLYRLTAGETVISRKMLLVK
jgi:hypothetical protein